MSEEAYISNQICVQKNDKALIELLDKLNPAPMELYAHMHARGDEDASGWKRYSNIGVRIKDYSNGTGVNSFDVEANITPEEVSFLLSRVTAGFEVFEWGQSKIFGEPDQEGHSSVTVFRVKRSPTTANGEPMNYPWSISIDNGVGIPATRANGGTYCQKGSFKRTYSGEVKLTDLDFFRMFYRAQQFILMWESLWGPHLYQQGKAALAERMKANNENGMTAAA